MKVENPELFKYNLDSVKTLDEKVKFQLLCLLYKYIHVFSVDDDDLGKTNIVKHKIVPKSDEIVYRRQYRNSDEQQKK